MIEATQPAQAASPGYLGPEDNQFPAAGATVRKNMRTPAWCPPLDIYETDEALVVRVEVAGMQESDFQIAMEGKTLTIRGSRQDTQERRAFHQMEIRFGEFSCEVEIQAPVLVEQVDASYADGFLLVVLPWAEATWHARGEVA
jgi:HSP20 family protein